MSETYTNPEDDPSLTAHALGELDAAESARVQERLTTDPAAAAHVAAVRREAATLTAALKSEPEPALARHRGSRWPVALAAAATLAAVGLTTFALMPSLDRARHAPSDLAMNEAREADAPGEAAEAAADPAAGAGFGGGGGGYGDATAGPAESQALGESDRVARSRAASPADARADAARRLGDDADAAEAAGDVAAAGELRQQLATVQRQQPSTPPPSAPTASAAARDAADPYGGYDNDPARVYPKLANAADAADAIGPGRFNRDFDTEEYDHTADNDFKRVADHPLSTFGVDVDTASYSNVRRFLTGGQLPPPDATRIEELVNYFDYDYAPPAEESPHPFAASVEVAAAPWSPDHRLVRVGLKAKEVSAAERKPSNLVFLLDVSGSMQDANKLPLVKASMKMLLDKLDARDRVAIAVYAGGSGLALPSTPASDRQTIINAIDSLAAGGSTNGAQGIELAYELAQSGFIDGGVNRVVLCTDGDFNVGVTDQGSLVRLIEDKAKSGVYLSVLGFGMGNLNDATMEMLSNKGEGNYAYVDTEAEARKVLVEQMSGTLQAVAKDVKVQVEFNPAQVSSYRLIGYENRVLAKEDFNDDVKDAGDVGAGHEVTALYEVVPTTNPPGVARFSGRGERDEQIKALQAKIDASRTVIENGLLSEDGRGELEAQIARLESEIRALQATPVPPVDDLKYQDAPQPTTVAAASGEMLTVKLRYKQPDAPKEQGTSTLVEFPARDGGKGFEQADADFQFAAKVAGFGMLLRDSPHKGTLTWPGLEAITADLDALGRARLVDPEAIRRAEFRDLVQRATRLAPPARR